MVMMVVVRMMMVVVVVMAVGVVAKVMGVVVMVAFGTGVCVDGFINGDVVRNNVVIYHKLKHILLLLS